MTEVLFANSYFYKLDAKQWRFKQPYPPLGTLWAAAKIRAAGFSVGLFDSNLSEGGYSLEKILIAVEPTYLVIYDDGFNYLTKMCLSVMREQAFIMAELGKKNNCTVIICSSDASDHYDKYFDHGVDYVVRGEGEETLTDLIVTIKEGRSIDSILGIAYQRVKVYVNPSRPVIRDLDTLPMPAWDLIDMPAYKNIWRKHHGYFSLNLATTRGCPYKCNWCAKPIYGNRYNSRSPKNVVDEIEFLITHHQVEHFWMSDDIFGLKPGWVQLFNEEIKKRNLNFRYKIQSRVDLLVESNTVKALSESGAETVWVGAESGSQKILDAMDKGTTVEQIKLTRKLLKDNHIKAGFFLQFGYLGETQHDINKTLQMVLELMPDEIGISVSYPLPGTSFYDKVKNQMKEKQNWSDSDELAMMFQGTYPRNFYPILHRYIHNRYRIERGKKIFDKKNVKPISLKVKELASMLYNIPLAWFHAFQLQKISTSHGE
jgi:anaerobic magnesium-protoporphyrin IX monomethyl ester cyclase